MSGDTARKSRRSGSKRKTPLRDVSAWLDTVLEPILGDQVKAATNPQRARLLTGELAMRFPPHAFTEESAQKVVDVAERGKMPPAILVKEVLDVWMEVSKPPEQPKSTLMISEKFRNDPRFPHLSPNDQHWIAFWERRHAEIVAGDDRLWDDSNPDKKARSQRINLISLVRQQSPKAFEMIALPMGDLELPEARFVRERYGSQVGLQSEPSGRRKMEDDTLNF